MADGKIGKIAFADGISYEISKRKDGALQVKVRHLNVISFNFNFVFFIF